MENEVSVEDRFYGTCTLPPWLSRFDLQPEGPALDKAHRIVAGLDGWTDPVISDIPPQFLLQPHEESPLSSLQQSHLEHNITYITK